MLESSQGQAIIEGTVGPRVGPTNCALNSRPVGSLMKDSERGRTTSSRSRNDMRPASWWWGIIPRWRRSLMTTDCRGFLRQGTRKPSNVRRSKKSLFYATAWLRGASSRTRPAQASRTERTHRLSVPSVGRRKVSGSTGITPRWTRSPNDMGLMACSTTGGRGCWRRPGISAADTKRRSPDGTGQ